MRVFTCISLLLFLYSCQTIRDAQNPYALAPKNSHSIWVPTQKAAKRIITAEEDFSYLSKQTPLTLGELIDITLLRNPKTKASWSHARVASAEYGQSLKNDFILADLDGGYTRERGEEYTSTDRSVIYETLVNGEISLSYIILDFGQTRASSEAALQTLYNADWMHNREIQTTMTQIMNDYYDYLDAIAQLEAANEDVYNAQVTLDAVLEKLNYGVADIADKVQATTQLLKQKLRVVGKKKQLSNSYTKLLSDLGVFADEEINIENYPKKTVTFEVEEIEKLIHLAIDNRPDLLAEEANIRSKESKILLAERKRYPVVTGDLDFGRTYYGNGVNDGYDFTASVSFTFPLFQGYFLTNGIKLAKSKLGVAKANFEQKKLNIYHEVTNYKNDVAYARESIEYAREFLLSAEEDFKLNLQTYRVGTGTIVELIQSQALVADARSQLADAKKSWYVSLANLAYATGTLLPKKSYPFAEKLLQKNGLKVLDGTY